MSRKLMNLAMMYAAITAYASEYPFGHPSPRLDAPIGNIPSDKQKCQPFGWVKDKKDGHHALITAVNDDTCGNAAWSLSGIMDSFTFADGAPFGVKEEE